MNIGQIIREARKDKGFRTVESLAKVCNVPASTIRSIELGQNSTYNTINSILPLLGLQLVIAINS